MMAKKLSSQRIKQLTVQELSRAKIFGQITSDQFSKAMNKIWKGE